MSKFKCTCGNVISDVVYPSKVSGYILSGSAQDSFLNFISETIEDYFRHATKFDIEGWRQKHFDSDFPRDMPGGEMIEDVLTNRLFDLTLDFLECDKCGRLWIQRDLESNNYLAFVPDTKADPRVSVLGYSFPEASSTNAATEQADRSEFPLLTDDGEIKTKTD